jgi:hypothetical protein
LGQLAFKTRAIALQPSDDASATASSGLVYYVAKDDDSDHIYRVAYWDLATNSNHILPGGSLIKPADKLTFGPDGKLYVVSKDEKDEIYTINTTSGEWTLVKKLNEELMIMAIWPLLPTVPFTTPPIKSFIK